MCSIKNLDKKYYYEVTILKAIKINLIYFSNIIFEPGTCVRVPLRNQKVLAVVLREVVRPKRLFHIKSILSLDKNHPPISSARLKWLMWIASYYCYSLPSVIRSSFFFSRIKIGKDRKKIQTPKIKYPLSPANLPNLTKEQDKCVKEISCYSKKGFKVHLIHGVTGSGKTEIYLRLIEPFLLNHKSVLVLVPEIALTPQHIERFSLRFPNQVACFHSGVTPKEKSIQWMSVLKEEKKILIGPRSVLFCPIPHLAFIIVDEEHESHFKQEDKLKYHGRDTAIYLGKCLDIPVVLGSATPSIESWWNAKTHKYKYHHLKNRVFRSSPPKIEVVDMRKKEDNLNYWLSPELHEALEQTLKKGEQGALFLNRRGETGYVFCSACGFHFSCPNCDISLTQHQGCFLTCHYCLWRQEKPEFCPQCAFSQLSTFGLGTQALEKQIAELFPTAKLVRADRDQIKNHKDWIQLIRQVEKKEVDILVGTQMIAKGLDFPYLNLVGLVLADQGLNRPDFRSAEKSFQLITQMAGRSGRRKQKGRVILQTYNPSHPVIEALKNGDYESFVKKELAQRKKYSYPPFNKLVLVRVQSLHEKNALREALEIKEQIKKLRNLKILGPAPAPFFRLRNKYRYHLLFKSSLLSVLHQACSIIASKKIQTAVQVHINRDPIQML